MYVLCMCRTCMMQKTLLCDKCDGEDHYHPHYVEQRRIREVGELRFKLAIRGIVWLMGAIICSKVAWKIGTDIPIWGWLVIGGWCVTGAVWVAYVALKISKLNVYHNDDGMRGRGKKL